MAVPRMSILDDDGSGTAGTVLDFQAFQAIVDAYCQMGVSASQATTVLNNLGVSFATVPPLEEDKVASIGLTPIQALEVAVKVAIYAKYQSSPVRLRVEQSAVMVGYNFVLSIPGQVRSVFVSKKDMDAGFDAVREKVCEDVLFAIFVLLEEDED